MMSTVETLIQSYEFNRGRTLSTLTEIEKLPNPQQILAWRPGQGRAHIAWQLAHIGVTEEVFADRLAPGQKRKWSDWWPRFRGGSTPDDDVPRLETIRELLADARSGMLDAVRTISDSRLDEVPAWSEKKWSLRTVLQILAWHEPHHQGQAHATLNAYKALQK